MSGLTHVRLAIRALRRRLLLLLLFAGALLGMAGTARLLSVGAEHAELDRIFELGGPVLGAAFLVFGWVVGRFPLLATLVLLSGVFSQDRSSGTARLYAARPVWLPGIYGTRLLALGLFAFVLSALLLPLFDLVLLGRWAGPGTLVLAAAWVITYGSMIALLSVWTRADAWVALLLGIVAMSWHAFRAAGLLDGVPAGGRQFLTLVLPPHGSLLALETAFGQMTAIPWDAFFDVCSYGFTLLVLAGLALRLREL